MGNYKFRLSDIIPNALYFKPKNINTAATGNQTTVEKTQPNHHHHIHPRKSYHFTRNSISKNERFHDPSKSPNSTLFLEPPRNSSKQRRRRKTETTTSSGCATTSPPPDFPSKFKPDLELASKSFDEMISLTKTCNYGRLKTSCANLDLEQKKIDELNAFDATPEIDQLHGIETKQAKNIGTVKYAKRQTENNDSFEFKTNNFEKTNSNCSSSLSSKEMKEHKTSMKLNSPRMRLRLNYSRMASKKLSQEWRSVSSSSRRAWSDSYAIVKSSMDPGKDFRESMVEMILENGISSSKELEDLVACYLNLNSETHHDVIIEVFMQIWFVMFKLRLEFE